MGYDLFGWIEVIFSIFIIIVLNTVYIFPSLWHIVTTCKFLWKSISSLLISYLLVCIGVLDKFSEKAKATKTNDIESLEALYRKTCKGFTHPREKRFCWYIGAAADSATNILREISRPMNMGVPNENICSRRLKPKDAAICALRYVGSSVVEDIPDTPKVKVPVKKIDWNAVPKMKIKQIRQLLSSFGADCDGCVEKSDYIRKLRSVAPKEEL